MSVDRERTSAGKLGIHQMEISQVHFIAGLYYDAHVIITALIQVTPARRRDEHWVGFGFIVDLEHDTTT
jgi:hypothetical protein